jgi:hypothetical protein
MTARFGGYFDWRLFPKYLGYYDGRVLPFRWNGFTKMAQLLSLPPGAEWQQDKGGAA